MRGLAIIYNDQWTPRLSLSKYTRSVTCNAERLLLVFDNVNDAIPPIAIMLAYYPPSSILHSFKLFMIDMFSDIATLQTSSDIETTFSLQNRI